jgi:molybdopterin-biosynthesis enzyme MoeA-like protein
MQGLAEALLKPLVAKPEHVAWMKERCRIGHQLGYFDSPEPNAGLLKMCKLPEGVEAMPNELGTALGAIVTAGSKPTTLFTLPGVPREFYRMFDQSVRGRLVGSAPIHTEELVLYTEESRLFPILESLEKEFPGVVLGSYPERGRIRIRATGPQGRARELIAKMREAAQKYVEPQGRFQGDKNVGEAPSGLPEIDFDRNH